MARKQESSEGFERFKSAIKAKTPGNFYIFCGEEAYLRSYWLDRLHQLVIEPLTEEFNFHRFTSETISARAVAESMEALPMMGSSSMIQIEDVDLFKLAEQERTAFAELFADIPAYCTVVLVYDTVEYKPDKRFKALAEAMSKAETVVFQTPGERELCTWIARHFKSHGKVIDYPTAAYLMQVTGGSMTTLASEILKIAAYSPAEAITKETIDAVVEPVLEAVAFDLSDAVAGGRYDTALAKLGTLFQMQEEPIAILGALSSQLRRILTAKTLLRAGKGVKELMSLCGIPSYPAGKTVEFARRLSDRFCERAVILCLETDEKMKTSYDDPERLLELLVLTLAQEARHG